MRSQKVVTPLKNGVQAFRKSIKGLDSPVKPGNDEIRRFATFYEAVMFGTDKKACKVIL